MLWYYGLELSWLPVKVSRASPSREGWAYQCRQSASGADVLYRMVLLDCTMSADLGALGRTMTRKWRICFKQFWRRLLLKGLIGRYAALLKPLGSQRVQSNAILEHLAYSPTGPNHS